MTTKAIVLLSGGIDSSVCLALALEKYDEIQPVHMNYGQQTEQFERKQARNLVHHYHQERENVNRAIEVNYHQVFGRFAGGITDRTSFRNEDGSFEEDDGRSTGYVPMRNLHFAATAAAIADVEDADAIYIGVQGGDEHAYPDCRAPFITAVQNAVDNSLADGESIEVRAPLLSRSKTEVIQLGENLGVPWEYTYSCYEAIEETLDTPEPCGACPACIERGEAFFEARVEDPFGTLGAIQQNSPDEYVRINPGD